MLTRCPADLTVDLVIEVLRQHGLRIGVCHITGSSHQLLELDTCDEVLVLRCHQAIATGQQEDLVVTLRALRIFHQVSIALLFGQTHELLRAGDHWQAPIGSSAGGRRWHVLLALTLRRAGLPRAWWWHVRGRKIVLHKAGRHSWRGTAIQLWNTGWWLWHLRWNRALLKLRLQLRGQLVEALWKSLEGLGMAHVSLSNMLGDLLLWRWCGRLSLATHLSLNFLQTHHLSAWGRRGCRHRARLGLFLRDSPDAGLGLQVWNESRVRILLIARPLGGRLCVNSSCLSGNSGFVLSRWRGLRVLQAIADLLLANGVSHLGSLAKEVKIPADWCDISTTTESIVVKRILVIVELVA